MMRFPSLSRRYIASSLLNNEQRRIVYEKKNGVSLVCAGPGSGKTKVLAHRIVQLLEDISPHSSVVALTFSNKAQQEMKNRIEELNPPNLHCVKVYTFHSFCSRILRTYGRDILGELVQNPSFDSNFSTLDQQESLRMIKNILRRNSLSHLKEVEVYNRILKSKESNVLKWSSKSNECPIILSSIDHMLIDAYEKILRENNVADFSDLLILTWRLLKEYSTVRANLQREYQHILIDEYQDTNKLQYEITKLLYQPPDGSRTEWPRSLFVVGDVNQSIYSWRGALPENLAHLSHDFPMCAQFDLKVNYRSSPNILAVANALVGNNSTIPSQEKLTAEHLPVYIYSAKDDIHQAEFICRSLKSMSGKSRAILYRTNAQSHALEVALMHAGVKYKVRGSKRYIDRKEVQDFIAYLRFLVNPRNQLALKRSINTPARGIGEKSQSSFFKWVDEVNLESARKNHVPPTLLDYFYAIKLLSDETSDETTSIDDEVTDGLDEMLHEKLAHSCPLNHRERRALLKYASLIIRLHQLSRNICLSDLVNYLLTTLDYRGYIDQLSENDHENATERWGNILEVINTAERYSEKNGENFGIDLENFIEYFDCFQNSLEDIETKNPEIDTVELMTIHASKGLEFDVVVIAGVEEGVLPLTSDGNSEEEEKRLAYVAITRARNFLILSYRESLRKLRNNGSHYRMKTIPSRFLTPLKSLPPSTCVWVSSSKSCDK